MLTTLNYNSKLVYFITIFGLFAVNFLLKLSFLGSEPFWYDEIISVKSALLDFGHVKHQSEWDNNPPFYYYSLWVWIRLFGLSELKVRALSVLFSSLSASLLFILGKKHFNYLSGLAASLIFTLHNFSYEYSHEARCYALVVLLGLLSSFIFLEFLRTQHYRIIVFLGLINFLIIYTHYIAGLILLFQFVYVLSFKRDLLKSYLWVTGISLLLVSIRFTKKQFILIFAYDKGAETFWLKTADLTSFKTAVINLFSGPGVYWVLLTLFFLALVYFFIKKNSLDKDNTQVLLYFLVLVAGSFFLLFIVGLYKAIFLDRYLLFIVPWIALITGWFIFNSHKLAPALLLLVLILQALNLNLNPVKSMDLRLAAQVAKVLQSKHNALIIIQTKDITGLFTYYYNKGYFTDHKTMKENLARSGVLEIENHEDLEAIPYKNKPYIVLCQTFAKEGDSNQIFDIFKQNNYAFSTSKAVKGVKVSLIKKF